MSTIIAVVVNIIIYARSVYIVTITLQVALFSSFTVLPTANAILTREDVFVTCACKIDFRLGFELFPFLHSFENAFILMRSFVQKIRSRWRRGTRLILS